MKCIVSGKETNNKYKNIPLSKEVIKDVRDERETRNAKTRKRIANDKQFRLQIAMNKQSGIPMKIWVTFMDVLKEYSDEVKEMFAVKPWVDKSSTIGTK